MKTKIPSTHFHTMLGAAALAAFGLLSLAPATQAKDKDGRGNNGPRGNERGNNGPRGNDKHGEHGNPHHDHDQQVYHGHPVAKFQLNKGNGYAGQGYYYGPPNAPYYYQRPGVSYYAKHGAIPRQYQNQNIYRMNSDDYRVQQALARLGYYRGPVDGQMGPQSFRAISSYQQSQGMRVTGAINALLLRALGLY